MQHCDSTCWHCARHFFTWWKGRTYAAVSGRSGAGDFQAETLTSRSKG